MPQNGQSANVRAIAKAGEPDRYLAALLAKPSQRDGLIAVAAFGSEIAHIPIAAHDPMLRRIKFQWWRDALQAAQDGGTLSGHPVADGVASAIGQYHLPLNVFQDTIDAWDDVSGRSATGDELEASDAEIATSTTLFHLAAIICGAQPTPSLRSLTDDAGRAYGIARSLLRSANEGNITSLHTTCLTHLTAARLAIHTLPRSQRLSVLPLALVEPYLHLARANTGTQASIHVDISPLSRIWRIWWSYSTSRP